MIKFHNILKVSRDDYFMHASPNDPNAPAFTNRLYQNTNLAHREYDALEFQTRYRFAWRKPFA